MSVCESVVEALSFLFYFLFSTYFSIKRLGDDLSRNVEFALVEDCRFTIISLTVSVK